MTATNMVRSGVQKSVAWFSSKDWLGKAPLEPIDPTDGLDNGMTLKIVVQEV